MKISLKACRLYERDPFGRLKEIRWDEYLLMVEAMEKGPDNAYHQGRLLIKLDPGVSLKSAGLLHAVDS